MNEESMPKGIDGFKTIEPLMSSFSKSGLVYWQLLEIQFELQIKNMELVLTQNELEALWQKYYHLFKLVPVGLCRIEECGLILEVNQAFANLLKTDREELIRSNVKDFFSLEGNASTEVFPDGLDYLQSWSGELLVKRSGDAFFRVRAELIREPKGGAFSSVILVIFNSIKQ